MDGCGLGADFSAVCILHPSGSLHDRLGWHCLADRSEPAHGKADARAPRGGTRRFQAGQGSAGLSRQAQGRGGRLCDGGRNRRALGQKQDRRLSPAGSAQRQGGEHRPGYTGLGPRLLHRPPGVRHLVVSKRPRHSRRHICGPACRQLRL